MSVSLPGSAPGRPRPASRLVHPLLVALGALVIAPADGGAQAAPDPYELGIAQREAGRLRGLVERLNKQNLLYQLHLGAVSKLEMQSTANEIDRLIEILEQGSTAYSVSKPPNGQVVEQIQVVSDAWSPLRRMSLASPYDYLRYSSDLMPPQSRLGDPLMIRGFDRRSQEMIEAAGRLMLLYQASCEQAGGELCDLAANSGFFTMLAERVAKELVLVYAGLDSQQSIEKLKESREMFETHLAALAESPILAAAQDPTRGQRAEIVKSLWHGMRADWERLRFEVDLAIDDRAEALDIRRMLERQRRLVGEMERLRAALSRYAAFIEESR